MTYPFKKIPLSFIFVALSLHSIASGQIDTAPVGFNKVVCLPDSDTYCSVPFVSKWEFQGLISGTPTAAAGQTTITPQSPTSWNANRFATFYFVRVLSGTKAGMYYQITGNDSGALTLDLAGDDFAGVIDGDAFAVSRFWTLGTLFPPATQTTIVASISTLTVGRRTQLLIPDLTGEGVNRAASHIFFIHDGHWKRSITGFPTADDFILVPDTYFIVRHSHPSITASTNFNSMGTVEPNPVSIPLATLISGPQDNAVASSRPIPIKLQDLDLMSGAFVGSAGTLTLQRRDQLLVQDNGTAGINRAASGIFYFDTLTSNWRAALSGNSVANDVEILPSTGIIIRKYQTTSGESQIWTHSY